MNVPQSKNPPAGRNRKKPLTWITAAVVAMLLLLSSITSVDRIAETEHDALFQRALITFALARTLNGVISAVQGTEVALQPAGVGVTLTPGEALDPINDMIERFSWIMLGASLSLGVQQVLLDVGQWWGVRVLLAALGLGWLWWRLRRQDTGNGSEDSGRLLFRVFIIVLFIRFAVPVAMIANEGLYRLFLESRFVESTQVIESVGAEIAEAGDEAEAKAEDGEGGFLEYIGRGFESTAESVNFREKLARIGARASDVIEHLIQLAVVFILQTGILPIAFLWIFLQLFQQIFRQKN
jgi:hypothetical protein